MMNLSSRRKSLTLLSTIILLLIFSIGNILVLTKEIKAKPVVDTKKCYEVGLDSNGRPLRKAQMRNARTIYTECDIDGKGYKVGEEKTLDYNGNVSSVVNWKLKTVNGVLKSVPE